MTLSENNDGINENQVLSRDDCHVPWSKFIYFHTVFRKTWQKSMLSPSQRFPTGNPGSDTNHVSRS